MSRLARKRRRRARRSGAGPAFLFVSIVVAVAAIGGLGTVGYLVGLANSAPALSELKPADQGSSSVVYASDGSRLGFIQYDILRTPIPGNEIPQTAKDATIAIEDERFWQHSGVDFEGVIRAAIKNVESGRTVEGGSTLTMQLVRNLYISNERTFKRKLHEAKLAEELEEVHDKRWILHKYLNNAPYGTVGGQTAVGIQAASRVFFDKPASRLKVHEAALLAGLPQAPSQYNPFYEESAAKRRRNAVLDKMAELRMIQPQTAAEAKERPLGVKPSRFYTARRESFFFDYVRQELIDKYGPERVRRGGLRIHTTIDLKMQRKAREAISSVLSFPNAPKSAIVTVDPRNGKIRAMASSANYSETKFNLAAQGKRQPGSTFKIMGLMAALKRGVSPEGTTYTSKPLKFNDPAYGPIETKTYDNSYGGSMDLVRATLKSDNSVFMQLGLDVGPRAVKEAARDMGIRSKLNAYPAEILGGLEDGVSPLEMANAYATIASNGMRNRPIAIEKVTFPDGTTENLGKPRRHRAFSDGVARKATDIMRQNVTSGTGTSAGIGCPSAGKTGTTDNHTDAWYVGYTPNLATAVWVGYPTKRVEMYPPVTPISVAGGTYPAQIWGRYMREVRKGCGDFRSPKNAFQAAPFFGRYASTGAPGGGSYQDGTGQQGGSNSYVPGPTQGGNDTTQGTSGAGGNGGGGGNRGGGGGTGGGNRGGGGNGGFDPDLYETPPQASPQVQSDTGGAGTG
jgi:penicillin-binding protein 1A